MHKRRAKDMASESKFGQVVPFTRVRKLSLSSGLWCRGGVRTAVRSNETGL